MGELENGARAIRNASEKIVSLFNFAKGASRTGSVSHTGKNFGKVHTAKAMCRNY